MKQDDVRADERVAEQLSEIWRRWRQISHPVRRGAVTWGQYMLLRRIWRDGPMTVSALARAEGVRPSTVTITTKRLQELGYLCRDRSVDDERVVLVSLTDQARDQLGAWRDGQLRALSELVARLTPEERGTLEKLLGRILAADPHA